MVEALRRIPESVIERRNEQKESLQLGNQIVVLMGPEGSGKSSVAEKLAEESGKPWVSVGKILRDMAEHDQTEYGDECRAMFREHRYFDSDMLGKVLVHRFSQPDLANGFILDGGMRKLEEVEVFPSILQRAGRDMPVSVVLLRIPGWMSAQRLLFAEDARKRPQDDTVEGVLGRLSNYYNQLGEKVKQIQQQDGWQIFNVSATGTKEETYTNARIALEVKAS